MIPLPPNDDTDGLADTRAYILQLEQAHDQRLADLNAARTDSARLDWLERAGKGALSPLWAQDWVKIRSAIDHAMGSATDPVAVKIHEDTIRLKGLRRLCGYVENGSDTVVKLFQDDATRTWFVKVGEKAHYGCCLTEAIDVAIAANPDDLP